VDSGQLIVYRLQALAAQRAQRAAEIASAAAGDERTEIAAIGDDPAKPDAIERVA
jgi:hypothetical protein